MYSHRETKQAAGFICEGILTPTKEKFSYLGFMIRNSTLIFLSIFICINSTYCQSYVGIGTGFSTDLENPSYNFHYIPVAIQWKSSRYAGGFILKINEDIPLGAKATDMAYTINPSLPTSIEVQKNIRPYIFTLSAGFRIHLFTDKKKNIFYLDLMPFGLNGQNIHVTYANYDKANYNILNPDEPLNGGGLYVSAAVGCRMSSKKSGWTMELQVQSLPTANVGDYALSYGFCAPLQLTVQYDLFYNKNKKAK